MTAAKRKATAKGPSRAPAKKTAPKMAQKAKPGLRPAKKATPPARPKVPAARPKLLKPTPAKPAKAPSKPTPPPRPPPAKAPAPKAAPPKPAPTPPPAPPAAKPAPAAPTKAPAAKPAAPPAPAAVAPAAPPKPAAPPAAPKAAAPPAPAAKPAAPPVPREFRTVPTSRGEVVARDPDLQSALTFGVFAAINRTFGAYGKSLLKHASERFLEYEQKRGHLPPTSKDPVAGLEAFFDRLVAQGYAKRVSFTTTGPTVQCIVEGIPEWDAIEALRQLSYPLLPVFPGEVIATFLTKYYGETVAVESTELVADKRGIAVKFTHRARQDDTTAAIPEVTRTELYE